MLRCFTLFIFLFSGSLCAQYQFKGSLSPSKSGEVAYLSLLDDYRKTSRVYTHQIIQKATVDSLGQFVFEGATLPVKNRLYAIHVDDCNTRVNGSNHFLTHCPSTQRLLFIANQRDTIDIPLLQNKQAFCTIVSNNPASALVLEFESIKEEMVLDFMDTPSEANQELLMRQWFKKLQAFASKCNEPLLALQVYAFLSDTANETSDYYQENLKEVPFYLDLEDQLQTAYRNTNFTKKYSEELHRDTTAYHKLTAEPSFFDPSTLVMFLVVLIGITTIILYFVKQGKKTHKIFNTNALSPQELKVFKAIQTGQTNKEIATKLFISVSTVKTHINNIYKKLGVSKRSEIIV